MANDKEYRELNKETIKARAKIYYIKNKEKIQAQHKEYMKGKHAVRVKLTIKLLQEMNKKYDEGLNMKELGLIYGIGESTVCNYIWKPRTRGSMNI
jgi:hypothetical protein